MTVGKVSQPINIIAFKGYDKVLDSKGNEVHSFYYPHSDDYRLQLELLAKPKKQESAKGVPVKTIEIPDNSYELKFKPGMDKIYDMYYRFKLIDKKSGETKYALDDGLIADDLGDINGSTSPFNRILLDRKIVSKPGRMQLQMPDIYYPGVDYISGEFVINEAKRQKAISTVKNHVNCLGGTLNGMTYMLPKKAEEGYTRIVGTPFTKDEISSHLYWTQNAYQITSGLGALQDMKRFQQALFRNGINFVADAALVNEGLQGIHFANVMKWGKDSPFFTWFKTFGLNSSNLSLGVIPKDTRNVRMKIINSPVNIESNPVKNEKYDPKKPTYVQLYDARLVTDEQEKSNKIFLRYEKNPDNHYQINSYDDAISPYSFEVNPLELKENLKKYGANNKDALKNIDVIKRVLNFSTFKIGDREAGGVELWDGNVDITKLNFSYGNYDLDLMNTDSKYDVEKRVAEYKQGIREVQDYAVLSGQYWTKLAADTQLEYAASAFRNVNDINAAVNRFNENTGKILPNSVKSVVDKDIISNVINNNYNLFKLNNISTFTVIDNKNNKRKAVTSDYSNILKKSIMNLPLESLEVGSDVAAILSSGYLTKRAGTDEQIGLTRFDIYKSNYPNLPSKYANLYKRTDNLLSKDVYKFVDNVISAYEKFESSEKIKNGDNITTFGKYAVNAIASDLTKYALLKALNENANISVEEDGTLNFDNIDKDNMSVLALDINAEKPVLEASKLVKKLENGVKRLNSNQEEINKLARAVEKRLRGLNENSFKLADMVIDRTESGIGLRIDASKDIASFDSVRSGLDDISKAWNDVMTFWSKYVKDGVQKENPHAYTTAEVTDVANFIAKDAIGDLKSAPAADRMMLEKVGATSIANYSYLFSMPTAMYSCSPEDGNPYGVGNVNEIKSKMDCVDNPGWYDNNGLIYEGMPDSSIHSYTFVGNHDKPRILHVLGLDMGIFNSKSMDVLKKPAADVLGYTEDEIDSLSEDTIISGPAIAMGKRLKSVFAQMCESSSITEEQLDKINKAIANLAAGKYVYLNGKVENFKPDAFGTKPFDVVINDVLNVADLKLNDDKMQQIKDEALERMLAPAMEKFKSIYKMLMLLPGDPTDFAGDKEGLTGFETVSKNIYQQNRNAIRWEWLDVKNKAYKPFISKYNKEINDILALRKRPELSALNNGHTVSLVNYQNREELGNQYARKYSANLRYNKEGSMVVTIFGKPDINSYPDVNRGLGGRKTEIPYIILSANRLKEGLSAGLKEGTIFMNADSNDTTVYRVEKMNYDMPVSGNESRNTDIYVLKRYDGSNNIPITVSKADDNAIVLYRPQNN